MVGLKDGQLAIGEVSGAEAKFEVRTREAGTLPVTRGSITSLRSPAEQVLYESANERYLNPRLTDLWTGFVAFGYAQSAGNSTTTNLAVTASVERTTPRDRILGTFNSLYARDSTLGPSTVTANARHGLLGYSLNLKPRVFAFASLGLDYDQFQLLDLRFAPSVGLGYHVIKSDDTTFDLMAGGGLNREFFSDGTNRTSGELLFGDEYLHRFSRFTLHQALAFFPNLSSAGDYRMNFDLSAETKMWRWLSWSAGLIDRYLSNPIHGRKTNDLILSTSLRVSFSGARAATPVTAIARPYGVLVTVFPAGSDLYVNGVYAGRTSAFDQDDSGMHLSAGEYKLRIVSPGGIRTERQVHVSDGEVTRVGQP
jgi:putative salt-induced outer membrane protein YdiY